MMTAASSSHAPFHVVDLIREVRRHRAERCSNRLVDRCVYGEEIADEQMAAFAMAVRFCGLSRRELNRWTWAMINSGERLDFSSLSKPTVDKHSTGGVGDKITLPLVPLVASYGVAVPQLSGRGLGHTGGTLDKP